MMKGILIAFVCFTLILCSVGASTNKRDLPTLGDVLVTNFSSFAAALNKTNPSLWQRILSASAPNNEFTIFAPTNGAMNGNGLTIEQSFYHVTQNYIGYLNLIPYTTRATLYASPGLNNGSQVIAFTAGPNNTLLANGNTVLPTDYPASNGMVLSVTGILNIPTSSVRQLSTGSQFSQFATLLNRLPNNTLVMNDITLFLPNNNAFNNLYQANPLLQNYFQNAPISQVTDNLVAIFNNHVGNGAVYTNDLATGNNSYPNMAGNTLIVNKPSNFPNSSVTVNGNNVTVPNMLASNGVIHEIDAVLVPAQFNFNLENLLYSLNATSFLGALKTFNLTNYLNETEGTHTIFVPTNSALIGVTPNTDVLLYHIAQAVNISFSNNTVLSQLSLPSLANQNQRLYVSSNNNTNFVNWIPTANRQPYTTSKGTTVYLLNSVIPLPQDAVATLQNSTYSDFIGLLMERAADNYYNFSSPNVTIFAPTNDAFDQLPAGMIGYWRLNASMDDYINARQVINNHIVPGNAVYRFPDGVSNLTTAEGVVQAFRPASGVVTVNGNNISSVPILAANGVIYPVSGVLLPSNYSLNVLQILQGLAGENTDHQYTYNKFINAMNVSDQLDLLQNGEITVFAPSDSAFDAMAQHYSDLVNVNDTLRLYQILNNHIVYGEQIVGLNVSDVYRVGNNTNNSIVVTGRNSDNQPEIALYYGGNNDTQGTATVLVQTYGRNGRIYGINRVLGVSQESHGSSGLSTLEWVLIGIGGAILGLLLLAAVAGAAYYLLLRPKSGYRKIN